jgi:hypothetical protein
MDIVGITNRLRSLHPADLDALILAFPEAGPYVSSNAPAEKASQQLALSRAQRRRRVA